MKYAENLVKVGLAAVVAVGLAACSSKPKEPDMTKVCPNKLVQVVLGNQQAIEQAKPGMNVKDLNKMGLGAPTKTVRIIHQGDADLKVGLYPTAVPDCPFMLPGMTYTPVVFDDNGTVLGTGMRTMEQYHAKGWVIEGATFPWQDYNYGYVPYKPVDSMTWSFFGVKLF